jgi:hypothetical protein
MTINDREVRAADLEAGDLIAEEGEAEVISVHVSGDVIGVLLCDGYTEYDVEYDHDRVLTIERPQ